MTPSQPSARARRFDYFVIFAEMRTGSNFLEANLNELPGVICHGEAFNPHFIGHKGKTSLLDITLATRESDPVALIRRMRERTQGLPGFRFFHDHDPRVLSYCLNDPRCAKVILTRNPLESYVSLKIAAETGQWMLKDIKNQKSARVRFDAADFEKHLERVQEFQVRLLNALQVSGQTAFYISYEDIQDVAVLNGLAAFLGVEATLDAPSKELKKQNPEEITEKVVNAAQMEAALSRLDRFNLSRTPNFEPRRGPMVPSFQASAAVPLLYMPVRATGEARLAGWLAGFAQTGKEALIERFSHKSLRQWQRQTPGHLAFTVIRHPVARAHAAFCDHILTDAFPEIRATLIKTYKLPLPDAGNLAGYGPAEHHSAFLAFLKVLKGNLAGQTSMRIDASWATQSAVLQAFAQVVQPDLILRENRLEQGLSFLADHVGKPCPPVPSATGQTPFALASIYDEQIEHAAQDAYQRDYVSFGFGGWSDS